jgi:homoserine kinase
MALQWYNSIEISETSENKAGLTIEGPEATEDIPRDRSNLTLRAVERVFSLAGVQMPPLWIRVTVTTPLARGLGSSASAIVGGMAAANAFLGNPLGREQLVAEMINMEGHPDNVVACFFGGLTASLVTNSDVYVRKYYPAETLRCVLVIPDYQLATAKSRRVLPRTLPIKDAIFNMARIPFVIDKICSGDVSGLDVIMDDRLHQPHRRKLIPEYDVVESVAMGAGAAAVCLSGSGPTMLALTEEAKAENVATSLREALQRLGRNFSLHVVAPDSLGVRQAEEN